MAHLGLAKGHLAPDESLVENEVQSVDVVNELLQSQEKRRSHAVQDNPDN